MAESGVATPPEDTTTNRGTLADKHALATLTTPDHEYKPKSLRQQEEATASDSAHSSPSKYHTLMCVRGSDLGVGGRELPRTSPYPIGLRIFHTPHTQPLVDCSRGQEMSVPWLKT